MYAGADTTMKNSEKQHVAGEDSNQEHSGENQSAVYDNLTLQRDRSPEKRLLKLLCLSFSLGLGDGHICRELLWRLSYNFMLEICAKNP